MSHIFMGILGGKKVSRSGVESSKFFRKMEVTLLLTNVIKSNFILKKFTTNKPCPCYLEP